MAPDRIPPRYELKYLVPFVALPQLREELGATCALDAHSERAADLRYLITSLYLDTPALDFYRAKRDRAPRRLKPRVRTYGVAPSSSPSPSDTRVFVEVKRKIGERVVKTRAIVDDTWPSTIHAPPPEAPPALHDFSQVLARSGAVPTLLVRYAREAWFSVVDEYARVTFDTRLEVQPWSEESLEGDPDGWLPVDDPVSLGEDGAWAILELKSEESVPLWMQRLVRRHGLTRIGFSKYGAGVERVWGRHRFDPSGRLARFGDD